MRCWCPLNGCLALSQDWVLPDLIPGEKVFLSILGFTMKDPEDWVFLCQPAGQCPETRETFLRIVNEHYNGVASSDQVPHCTPLSEVQRKKGIPPHQGRSLTAKREKADERAAEDQETPPHRGGHTDWANLPLKLITRSGANPGLGERPSTAQ